MVVVGLGVVVDGGVFEIEGFTAVHLVCTADDEAVGLEGRRSPLAAEGGVEVDPGEELPPTGLGESGAVMALSQHLHEWRCRGVEFERIEDLEFRLGAAAADVGVQEAVGGFRSGQVEG